MPPIRDRRQLPDNAKTIADLIETFGFSWSFAYDHPLPAIERRLQIRDDAHNAPRPQVTQYAEAYRRGDKLPPIVVTADDYIVDGNTRTHGARHAKFPTLPAFILNEQLDGSTESVKQRLRALGAGLNTRNGRGIERNEIISVVLHLAANPSYTAVRIGALLNVTEAMINSILAEHRAGERASKLGISVNGSLKSTVLRTLGRASSKLNNNPFHGLFTLAQDAGMVEKDLAYLIKQVVSAGSDDKAMKIINDERAVRREQIAEYRASGRSRPSAAGQLRQHLGFIISYKDSVGSLIESNPSSAPRHLAQLRHAAEVLDIAASLQEESIDKREFGE